MEEKKGKTKVFRLFGKNRKLKAHASSRTDGLIPNPIENRPDVSFFQKAASTVLFGRRIDIDVSCVSIESLNTKAKSLLTLPIKSLGFCFACAE
jgi:hypothetical protein